MARIFFSKIRRNVSSRAIDRSRRIKQLAIFVSRLTVLTCAAFNQRRQAFKINEYARVCWTRVRSVAINYVSETKNYLEKYFTLSALRTLIKYIVRPIVPFPCALIMGHAKTKQQYADKVSLERLPNDRFFTAREERKEALNPFNRPQTRTNRQVSKNRRLTGGTTPCPRRDKGARAIRLVGKDQKEGRSKNIILPLSNGIIGVSRRDSAHRWRADSPVGYVRRFVFPSSRE